MQSVVFLHVLLVLHSLVLGLLLASSLFEELVEVVADQFERRRVVLLGLKGSLGILFVNKGSHVRHLHFVFDPFHLVGNVMGDVGGRVDALVDFVLLVVVIAGGVERIEFGVFVVLEHMAHLLLDRVVGGGELFGQGFPVDRLRAMFLLGTGLCLLHQLGDLVLQGLQAAALPETEVSLLCFLLDQGLFLVLVQFLVVALFGLLGLDLFGLPDSFLDVGPTLVLHLSVPLLVNGLLQHLQQLHLLGKTFRTAGKELLGVLPGDVIGGNGLVAELFAETHGGA